MFPIIVCDVGRLSLLLQLLSTSLTTLL